jgi:hypothetical protein
MTLSALGIFSAAGAGGVQGDYELISTSFGTGSSDTVTFNVSGLGSTYRHLQLRVTGQTLLGDTGLNLRFNSDTASNYSYHILYGNGSSVLSTGLANQSFVYSGRTAFSSNSSAGASVIDILDAFSTSKNKTVRSLYGTTATNEIGLASGAWRNTAAITSITLYAAFATANFTTASRFSLYGIRG